MARPASYWSRHLTPGETISDLMHMYGSDIVLHAALLRSNNRIRQDLLDHAVTILIQFQPALRACVSTEKEHGGMCKRFVLRDVRCDIQVLEASSRKSWVDIAEVELSRPFHSSRGPLWKVKYVEFLDSNEDDILQASGSRSPARRNDFEGVLLFTIHRVLADAICMFDMLYRQLVGVLNALLEGGDLSIFQTPLTLLPPVESAFIDEKPSVKGSPGMPLTLYHMTEKHHSQFRPLLTCLSERSQPVTVSTTRMLPFVMSAVTTRGLIERSYARGVSPKTVLLTAAAMSLGITAAANGLRIGNEISVCLPIDLRQYRTMPIPQPLGNWLAYDYCTVRKHGNYVEPAQFWNQTLKVHDDLLRNREGWIKLSAAKNYFNTHRSILKKIAKDQTVSPLASLYKAHFTFYDLGNCDLMTADSSLFPNPMSNMEGSRVSYPPNESVRSRDSAELTKTSVQMCEHFFSSSMSDVSTIPLCVSVCTYQSRFMWTLTYNGRWITKSFATKFIDRLLTTLDQLIRHDADVPPELFYSAIQDRPPPEYSQPPSYRSQPEEPAIFPLQPQTVPPVGPRPHPVEPGIEPDPLPGLDPLPARPGLDPLPARPGYHSGPPSVTGSGLSRISRPEDISKLPPFLRMQRLMAGAE